MNETLKRNIEKAFEEVSKKFDNLSLEFNESGFKIFYNGQTVCYGHTWNKDDKIEIRDPYNGGRHKWVKSFNKIKELVDDNVSVNLEEIETKLNNEKLLKMIKNILYITENYDFYSNVNGFTLKPKDYDKIFQIDVKYWSDKGIETYLKFSTWKNIKVEDLNKIDEAKEEFIKISEMLRGKKF